MLLQVEEIERRREENSRVNALPSMPPPSPPPTATHSTAPSWAMRGKLQGGEGKDGQENNKEPSSEALVAAAADADTDQNTAHFRQSGNSNVCCGMHAQNIMPENDMEEGRKEVGV